MMMRLRKITLNDVARKALFIQTVLASMTNMLAAAVVVSSHSRVVAGSLLFTAVMVLMILWIRRQQPQLAYQPAYAGPSGSQPRPRVAYTRTSDNPAHQYLNRLNASFQQAMLDLNQRYQSASLPDEDVIEGEWRYTDDA
jgi:hypothetical protein